MADSTVGKEFCLNGIPVKDLLATKSTFSRQEIRWMVDTLENCKIHAMGVVQLSVGGRQRGKYGAAAVTETNLQNIVCHYVRIVDLEAFTPYLATVIEQQLYSGMLYQVNPQGPQQHNFSLNSSAGIVMSFADLEEAQKFHAKIRSLLERETELALVEKAISKNNFETKRMDSGLQAAIHAAEATKLKTQAYYQAPTRTILDDFNEAPHQRTTNFERPAANPSGVQRGGARFVRLAARPPPSPWPDRQQTHAPPSDPAPPPPPRKTGPAVAPRTTNYQPPVVAARPEEVNKWSQLLESKKADAAEIVIRVRLPEVGGVKTLKLPVEMRVSEVVERALKTLGIADPVYHALFRRSGLQLDNDLTLAEQDVLANVCIMPLGALPPR